MIETTSGCFGVIRQRASSATRLHNVAVICAELARLRQLYRTALIRSDYLKATAHGADLVGIPKWRAAQERERAISDTVQAFARLNAHERSCLVCTNVTLSTER